jgi:hippurate hydrolase
VAIRRDLHAHPELAFEETRTAGIVAQTLQDYGVDEVHAGIGRTGVVGVVRGSGGGSNRAIGLRADMDALPILEKTGAAHASTVDGKMHACGHDGHTAMLLGAARYLAEHRDFDGTVYLIFQPAEERGGGAKVMIRDGLFDRFNCEQVYGLHNLPSLPAGRIAMRSGPAMASSDGFKITVRGKGAHRHGAADDRQPAARPDPGGGGLRHQVSRRVGLQRRTRRRDAGRDDAEFRS